MQHKSFNKGKESFVRSVGNEMQISNPQNFNAGLRLNGAALIQPL